MTERQPVMAPCLFTLFGCRAWAGWRRHDHRAGMRRVGAPSALLTSGSVGCSGSLLTENPDRQMAVSLRRRSPRPFAISSGSDKRLPLSSADPKPGVPESDLRVRWARPQSGFATPGRPANPWTSGDANWLQPESPADIAPTAPSAIYSLWPIRAEYSSRYRSAGSTMSAVSTTRVRDS